MFRQGPRSCPGRCTLEMKGAVYDVFNRGDRREATVRDDEDRRRFLATLEQACEYTLW